MCRLNQTESDITLFHLNYLYLQTGQARQVKHLQFTSWPDYGIPPAEGFLDFLLRVRACQADSMRLLEPAWNGHPNGPPMVVHCSAGIGRTGIVTELYTVHIFVMELNTE
jgi:protein tyrosine phosphatase